ncbi:hypothetical protein BJ944DRAFT_269292 [Cunninghamella echinulata]|nr:hypothetical protein BJ944DRAFT_269292 [Cunninghamella echinulata]
MNIKKCVENFILPEKRNKKQRLNHTDPEFQSVNKDLTLIDLQHKKTNADQTVILISDDDDNESMYESESNSTILTLEKERQFNIVKPSSLICTMNEKKNINDESETLIDLTSVDIYESDTPSSTTLFSSPSLLIDTSSVGSNDHSISTLDTDAQMNRDNKSAIDTAYHHDFSQNIILPNYDSLTMSELRNAVKKYGFKPKDRQEMITILQKLHKNINHSTSSSPVLLPPSSENNREATSSSATNVLNMEFLDHITRKTELWERMLRYEAVKFDDCFDGMDKKKKNALRIYLDENALIYKPPKSR